MKFCVHILSISSSIFAWILFLKVSNRTAIKIIIPITESFQNILRWISKKYGKLVVAVNESYTTKTRSWDGVIVDNLHGSSVVTDGNIVVNRDYNGARGILLRALTRQLTP